MVDLQDIDFGRQHLRKRNFILRGEVRDSGSTTMDPLPEHAIHSERQVKIICVGAGASGLCLAYKLGRSFRNFDLTVSHNPNPRSR
jgi:hypothetical protein